MKSLSSSFSEQRRGHSTIFSAPLGAVKKGHLEVTRGISNANLSGNSASQDLFQGQFTGLIPKVRTHNERVIIHYRLSINEWFRHLLLANRQTAKVMLNASISWQIDIHGGVAHLDADLRSLQLNSLVIAGGVAETDIRLPRPSGQVTIHMTSGVSNLRIFRPQGIPVRLKVGSGASQLRFDEHFYGSIGGEIRLETPDYKDETNCYDIRVGGGASHLTIRTQG